MQRNQLHTDQPGSGRWKLVDHGPCDVQSAHLRVESLVRHCGDVSVVRRIRAAAGMTGDPLASVTVEVEATFAAPVDRVWALLSDVERMAGLGPEHVAAWWETNGPEVGARFTGVNRIDAFEWRVPCVITACEPPHHVEWTVGEAPGQSSTWSYTLTSRPDGGTVVVQRFRHGPGFSYLRQHVERAPEEAASIVERRCAMLRQGMIDTLAAAAARLAADDH